MRFTIKRHDRAPSLAFVAQDVGGFPTDLSGFSSARFMLKRRDAETLKVNALAVIESAVDGRLRYDWAPGDTSESGVYFGEFEVVDASGRKRSFPVTGSLRVEIVGDLDDA